MSDYRINEIFLNAEELGEQVLIVEGVDDVTLYENMFKEKNYTIYAVETIEKMDSDDCEYYKAGCDGVKKAIEDLIANEANNTDGLKKCILGIVDKDVSDFRGELFESDIVVNLKHYAIESHFINPDSVYRLLKEHTKSGSRLINRELAQQIYSEIIDELEVLYLITLDSLKGAIDRHYTSIFGYSASDECYKNLNKMNQVQSIKDELLVFAEEQNLTLDESLLLNVTKGKWALSALCDFLNKKIKELTQKCLSNEVPQCQFCRVGEHKHCMYKLKDGITTKTLKTLAFNLHDLDSLKYIKDDVLDKLDS